VDRREWKAFFEGQAATYEQNAFTQHTKAEVDFFLSAYALPRKSSILDVGCGTGRHSIELARRGYRLTGIDLSPAMLDIARANSATDGVEVEWIEADATSFALDRRFDAAICLCEGGVGLIERGEDAEQHDLSIFKNIAACLKPGAPFLLTAMNGYAIVRQMKDELIAEGRFDPATMIASYDDIWDLPSGQVPMRVYERLFIPPEIVKMLQTAGFQVENVLGGTAGHWAHRFVSLDEVEAMFVCRRTS
jgi:2-polyprenyl-3-methyl-5-hydroxy-6-metoxy-1,4-benzoquinol methylase